MKIISVVLNVLLLGGILFTFVDRGLPLPSEDDFWLVMLVAVTPTVTLYHLLFDLNNESSLRLYVRRKIAEEEQKLRQLADRENP